MARAETRTESKRIAVLLIALTAYAGLTSGQTLAMNTKHFESLTKHYEKQIGPEGGKIEFYGVVLVIPAGALDKGKTITIDLARPKFQQRHHRTWGDAVDFGPDGLKFKKPITLELPLGISAERPIPPSIGVYWFDEGVEAWRRIGGGTLDAKERAVTASITHFSTYSTGSEEENPFQETYSLYNTYFVNNDEIISPATGTVSIMMKSFLIPGRSGLDLVADDILTSSSCDPTPSNMFNNFNQMSGPLLLPSSTQPNLVWAYMQTPGSPAGPYKVVQELKTQFGGGLHEVKWDSANSSTGSVHENGTHLRVIGQFDSDPETGDLLGNVYIYEPNGTKRQFDAYWDWYLGAMDRTGNTTVVGSNYSMNLSDPLGRQIVRSYAPGKPLTVSLKSGSTVRTYNTKFSSSVR